MPSAVAGALACCRRPASLTLRTSFSQPSSGTSWRLNSLSFARLAEHTARAGWPTWQRFARPQGHRPASAGLLTVSRPRWLRGAFTRAERGLSSAMSRHYLAVPTEPLRGHSGRRRKRKQPLRCRAAPPGRQSLRARRSATRRCGSILLSWTPATPPRRPWTSILSRMRTSLTLLVIWATLPTPRPGEPHAGAFWAMRALPSRPGFFQPDCRGCCPAAVFVWSWSAASGRPRVSVWAGGFGRRGGVRPGCVLRPWPGRPLPRRPWSLRHDLSRPLCLHQGARCLCTG